ncbi:hypothetical protein [Amycolatopsis sp. MtRt-6]|uniref:hypothetical protein n=1 Tax=Amycolatopsis sp. MtRt-6 TaxID=2792782 RepID=UPI001F5D274E|nr:hypothetical protein [Amycolatopsis sp. MtRt-6]
MRSFVVAVLVVELVACEQPVEVTGRAVPVPVSTGAPPGELLGDTPVAPVVVKL